MPLRCLPFQEVVGLAQTDCLTGLVFWSQIQIMKCLLGAIFLGEKSQCLQVTLVEDPAESLQYEILQNVTWIPAEISWTGITVIQDVFLCGLL